MKNIISLFKRAKTPVYSTDYTLITNANKNIEINGGKKTLSIKAINLLTPYRFDVMAKFIFAKYQNKNIDSKWHRNLYIEHLKIWNNLIEKGKTNDNHKNGQKTFINSFIGLLKNIKSNGFDRSRSMIWVNNEGNMVNGGHRLAASLLFKQTPICEIKTSRTGQVDCSSYYFLNRKKFVSTGLSQQSADAMALEYARLKKNTFIATIFPKAIGHQNSIRKILLKHGSIVYEKSLNLNRNGAFNYIKLLYDGEKWLGDWENGFYGSSAKLKLCYKNDSPFRLFLFECDNIQKAVEAKEKIRRIFNIDKNSIHINDEHHETIDTAEAIFNANSIHHLNYSKLYGGKYLKFVKLFFKFKEHLRASNIDPEDICIDASSVLSVYGLREGRDIDFLHNKKIKTLKFDKLITSHNSSAHFYDTSIDDIIYNPSNHFYFEGIKFTSLEILKDLKEKRREKKDLRDIKLIKKIN